MNKKMRWGAPPHFLQLVDIWTKKLRKLSFCLGLKVLEIWLDVIQSVRRVASNLSRPVWHVYTQALRVSYSFVSSVMSTS